MLKTETWIGRLCQANARLLEPWRTLPGEKAFPSHFNGLGLRHPLPCGAVEEEPSCDLSHRLERQELKLAAKINNSIDPEEAWSVSRVITYHVACLSNYSFGLTSRLCIVPFSPGDFHLGNETNETHPTTHDWAMPYYIQYVYLKPSDFSAYLLGQIWCQSWTFCLFCRLFAE